MRIIIWEDSTPQDIFNGAVNRAFNDLLKNYVCGNDAVPVFARVIGQSGAGKSTQGLPAVRPFFCNNSIVLTTADFLKYYPKQNGNGCCAGGNTREMTNGFCLRVMTSVLYKLIEKRVNIVLDMTVLTVTYEKILLKKLKKFNYRLNFFILAVPKVLSDRFIAKRKRKTGRIVAKHSAEFFNDSLQPAVELLTAAVPNAECVMWSAFDLKPIYYGKISGALSPFILARKQAGGLKYTCDKLLAAKIEFLRNWCR